MENLPPFRFFAAWMSFGICMTTGVSCLLHLLGVQIVSDSSSVALFSLDYSNKTSVNRSRLFELDGLAKCPHPSLFFAQLSQITATESALQVSFYTVGVHWANRHFQKAISFPLFIICIIFGILAVVTFLINCYWPITDEMETQPSAYKIRKIRMRVPQKNQKWSGYIYTHLRGERDKKDKNDGTNGVDVTDSITTEEEETTFDKQALRFLRKTISACGKRSENDLDAVP
ncbi:uncharacterized protein LOC129585880 [Paramacrobiotus metropolitanus]|uniref:uncharacterized protein LOC129585880 n=1 Tax=Paramacrobiotus metropolitanus TaxID=2943436 RepID=UPI002445A598|nr:uncharacterized protein LOC129585880 [Paramacrobiotus metropolitanus]